MLKVHRMAAVQVRAARDAISVARPQRTRRVDHVQTERLRVFTEAIDVRRGRQRGLDAEVLRFEYERVARSRKEYLARACARDVKRKRSGAVRELDLRGVRVRRGVRCGSWEDGLGDFVARARRVGYLEMDACFWGDVWIVRRGRESVYPSKRCYCYSL